MSSALIKDLITDFFIWRLWFLFYYEKKFQAPALKIYSLLLVAGWAKFRDKKITMTKVTITKLRCWLLTAGYRCRLLHTIFKTYCFLFAFINTKTQSVKALADMINQWRNNEIITKQILHIVLFIVCLGYNGQIKM